MIIDNQPFLWSNEPKHTFQNGSLTMITSGSTDFWQRTHYGFRADNAHALLTRIGDEFTFTARYVFEAKSRYDQGGSIFESMKRTGSRSASKRRMTRSAAWARCARTSATATGRRSTSPHRLIQCTIESPAKGMICLSNAPTMEMTGLRCGSATCMPMRIITSSAYTPVPQKKKPEEPSTRSIGSP